jgi:hypothetical protein
MNLRAGEVTFDIGWAFDLSRHEMPPSAWRASVRRRLCTHGPLRERVAPQQTRHEVSGVRGLVAHLGG